MTHTKLYFIHFQMSIYHTYISGIPMQRYYIG